MAQLAKLEIEEINEAIKEHCDEIVEIIIPKLDADERDVTMEVQSAAGGSESSLFAQDLVNMYQNYCR